MKSLFVLAVGCLAVTAAISVKNSRINGAYKSPNNINDETTTSVDFYLYTTSNPTDGQKIRATAKSILSSNFNPVYPTKFIIHGYFQDYLTKKIQNIRNAWLALSEYNIIVVDWPLPLYYMPYDPASAVPEVGEKVANLINYLKENHGMHLDDCHVIGYELGAHVAGYAGKNIKNGQVGAIIGLNPTRPSFTDPSKRLNSTDALYVETIQTDAVMGFKIPIGRATFYPNGGSNQPGCDDYNCDQIRSLDYYAEAISLNSFASIRCTQYEDALSRNCGKTYSSVCMGSETNFPNTDGYFYVPVNKNPPYGVLS